MHNRIHTTILYKTKEKKIKVTINYTQIRINIEPRTVELVNKIQQINNLLPSSRRWEFDNDWYKELKNIPFGLSNMWHKHKNYLAEQIEDFLDNVLKLQDYEVDVEGGVTKDDLKEYLKNLKPKAKKVANKRDSTLFPIFKPYYTAQEWFEISLKAYNKRKDFWIVHKENQEKASFQKKENQEIEPITKNDITTAIVLFVAVGHVGYCLYVWGKSVFIDKPTDFVPQEMTGKRVNLSIIDFDYIYPHINTFGNIIIIISFIALLVYFKTSAKEFKKVKPPTKEIKIVKNAIDPVTVVCIIVSIVFIWWNNRS